MSALWLGSNVDGVDLVLRCLDAELRTCFRCCSGKLCASFPFSLTAVARLGDAAAEVEGLRDLAPSSDGVPVVEILPFCHRLLQTLPIPEYTKLAKSRISSTIFLAHH